MLATSGIYGSLLARQYCSSATSSPDQSCWYLFGISKAIDDRHAMTLRLPIPLRLKLAENAKANGRSINAEIVQRLRVSLDGWKR
jgi:Arc-like DNA binding domain